MISKSSFLADMKENSKRRLWVLAVFTLVFIVLFPTFTALVINRITSRSQWLFETYEKARAGQILHERLISGMCGTIGVSRLMAVVTTVAAFISAVQGFSYLYSRKKIDFYMGMPIKRKRRFLNIWLNGILLYVIPYLTGLLISILIAAQNNAVDKTVIYEAAKALYTNLLFYLCIYHMAVLAVMLTGNIIITGFGFLVFCLYEYVVRIVVIGYKDLFFRYYSSYGMEAEPILSPFFMYGHPLKLFIFAIVVGILSYICYLKRPAEAAEKSMTFEITKPVVKILLIVPASLFAGLVIADAVGFYPGSSMNGIGYVLFTFLFVIVIGSALIQVIYEFDIKGILHKKTHIVISGVLTSLIFIGFRYDLTGYDGYIPKQNDIESVAFVPDFYDMTWEGGTFFDSDGSFMTELEYAEKYMELSNVADVCELAELSMKDYDQFLGQMEKEGYKEDQEEFWSYATLIYHLKNGRNVTRAVWVDVNNDQTVQLLDSIMGSEEFKKGYMQGASENLDHMLEQADAKRKISAVYGNGIYTEKMSEKDAKDFLEVYRRDLALANFSKIKECIPNAIFSLNIEEDVTGSIYGTWQGISGSNKVHTVSVFIYPFYEESIAWLKEHGYYMNGQLNVEDVARVQVINHNSAQRERLAEKQGTVSGAAADINDAYLTYDAEIDIYGDNEALDTRVYAEYTNLEEIEEIVNCVYPDEIVYSYNWNGRKSYDKDYEVIVYFKADSELNREYGSYAYYYFLEEEIPDFVAKDTKYTNYK